MWDETADKEAKRTVWVGKRDIRQAYLHFKHRKYGIKIPGCTA